MSKDQNLSSLTDSDIVLTTYETLAADWRSDVRVLGHLAWFRVVLDEGKSYIRGIYHYWLTDLFLLPVAHWIRNSATDKFRAVNDLIAERRWCLTGTPVQNALNDLFSLTKFLRLHPFDQDSSIRKYIHAPLQKNDQ